MVSKPRSLLPLLVLAAAAIGFPPPCLAAGAEPAAETVRLHGPPPVEIDTPRVALDGLSATIVVRAIEPLAAPQARVEIRDADGAVRAEGRLGPDGSATLELDDVRGSEPGFVFVPDLYLAGVRFTLRTLPGWLTLVPPLLAILMALVFREVVPALLAGVWVGAWIVVGDPFAGALRTIDTYIVGALADADHAAIVIFSLLLGGMVGIVSRSGGMLGLVEAMRPLATTARRGQLVTWLLGIIVFFDDYANTLLVGNTMRSVTDRLRIPREKLAYVVDSTAAPVASIALVSTWIGYEVSLIHDALQHADSDLGAYGVFLRSIPYNFYPLLALVFGLAVALTRRDFGPMLAAELRASRGRVIAEASAPLADFDQYGLAPADDRPHRWYNALLPVLAVLLVTFLGLWFTGRSALTETADPAATATLSELGVRGIGTVFGKGDSFRSLLWGSMSGCIVGLLLAVLQGILRLREAIAAWIGGMRSMAAAVVVLLLAWSIGKVCEELGTSAFMAEAVSSAVDPRLLPALIFVLAAATAFATGTSWATMSILIPPAVATAYAFDPDATRGILLGAISAVLAGAIFGDHCSPISDTTVMSSMASACDHIDHVRTQLPYALVVAAVAIVLGYLPSGFGLSPWLGLGFGAAALIVVLALAGRPADEPAEQR